MGILSIKNLKGCSTHLDTPEITTCFDCYSVERLQNTEANNCVIDGINNEDTDLLTNSSTTIEKLTLIVEDLVGSELKNLPYGLKNIVIVYKSIKYTPQTFYEKYKSNIKLPFGIKLHIVMHFHSAPYSSREQRHLIIR